MESIHTDLALYGSKNVCARTDTVFLSISEVGVINIWWLIFSFGHFVVNILLRQLIYLLQLILIFNGSANKRNASFELDKVETQILSFLDLVVSELPTFVILSHSPLSNTKSTLYSNALLSNVNNTRYIVHIILYTLHFILYTVHSTLYTVHCTLNTLYGILYTKHFIMYTVHCSLSHFLLFYSDHFILFTVHCIVLL